MLVIINIMYITFLLPETVKSSNLTQGVSSFKKLGLALEQLPNTNTWNLEETFRIFWSDPFMTSLAVIVLLYYTSVWAIYSTLMVYVTRQLSFSQLQLGWLLSSYGVATMISEALLVRWIVPLLGEVWSVRLGLTAFAVQCIIIAFATTHLWIFLSLLCSMLANLVYPSLSSLVSKVVDEHEQGEALGALNGIKALTEGFCPLVFGSLMYLFEKSPWPGAPYLLAAGIALWALLHSLELPPEPTDLITVQRKGLDGREDGSSLLSSSFSSSMDSEDGYR